MKAIALFGFLIALAYIGFRPPEGMRKFPTASIQFEVSTEQGTLKATLKEHATLLIDNSDQSL